MEIRPSLNSALIGSIDEMEIDKLLFKILTIIHSSKSMAESASGESDYRECLKERFATSEMMLGITTLAIIMRNKIENMLKYTNDIVGKITSNNEKLDYKPLYFKDACDKIIHAKVLNIEMECIYSKNCWYLLPNIHCYGTLRNQKWNVVIDIEKYCENIYKLTLL